MQRKVLFRQLLWIPAVSFALAFAASGPLMAQTVDPESQGQKGGSPPTPMSPSASPQAAKVLASEELSSGIRVDILELKRTSGGSVTLRFAVVNDTKQNLGILGIFSNLNRGGYDWDVSKIALLDTPNKKKYLVMTDSENHCVCSRGGSDTAYVRGGTRGTFWAKFQAPPENVTKLTVEIPGPPPFEDLPLGQ